MTYGDGSPYLPDAGFPERPEWPNAQRLERISGYTGATILFFRRMDVFSMSNRPQRAPWLLLCLLLIVVPASFSQAQASESAPVKKQLPADVRAYKAAEAVVDPEKRLAAMRSFVKEYPKSPRVSDAQSEIFKTLLD